METPTIGREELSHALSTVIRDTETRVKSPSPSEEGQTVVSRLSATIKGIFDKILYVPKATSSPSPPMRHEDSNQEENLKQMDVNIDKESAEGKTQDAGSSPPTVDVLLLKNIIGKDSNTDEELTIDESSPRRIKLLRRFHAGLTLSRTTR